MKFFEIEKYGVRQTIYLFGKKVGSYKNTNISVLEYLESMGVKMGKNVNIITLPNRKFPDSWPVILEPELVEIGDNTIVSFNCTFVTHDGSVAKVKHFVEKENLNCSGKIKIGKDCFIGCNATIMYNVTIGDNAIIGANSVVTKDVPAGEVWAGNPAKFITTSKELATKFVKAGIENAETVAALERERERERERESNLST